MSFEAYDERVPRVATRRFLPIVCGLALLAGCGSPPQPLPTAPPEPVGSGPPLSAGPVGPPSAIGGYPTLPPPIPTFPGAPTFTTRPVPTTTTTTPPPPPAPRCTGGPTRPQVLAVVKGRAGVPDDDLAVTEGPYCAGSWQFTIVGIAGAGDDTVEPLLVVTTGRPSALRVIEAGTDVCTDRVSDDAPPGIRVRACGS
jgi:hypothetical protein